MIPVYLCAESREDAARRAERRAERPACVPFLLLLSVPLSLIVAALLIEWVAR